MADPGPDARAQPRNDLGEITLAASADGIVAVDDQGIIRLCNPAAEQLFGRPAQRLIGAPFGYPLAAGATDIELMRSGRAPRVVAMRVTSTTWEDKPLHVVALSDVTRSRQNEAELAAALERQNILVAVTAHQLGNPLAAIAVLADVLRDPHAVLSDSERADLISRIAERTAHLQQLIRKLLTAARIDAAGTSNAPDPVPVLEFLLERIAASEPRQPNVRVSCDPRLVVSADRTDLTDMITNLIENAAAYGRPPITVRASATPDAVEVRVCDAGPGVPEDFVPRLFDRFSRDPVTTGGTAGSGLGLWIVRNLARSNGGDAWYEPGDHTGARFCVRLPAATRHAPPP